MRPATPPSERATPPDPGTLAPDASRSRRPRIGRLPPKRLRLHERARLASEIVATYAQARRELRRAPIESVIAALRAEPALAPLADPADGLEEARRLGWVVARTLRPLPGDTRCLTRSLVLTRLLARRGIPAKLVIGARPAPEFQAHAWVECEGEPVLSRGDGSFGRLVEL
jgi:Transglutaminase-like superfamily